MKTIYHSSVFNYWIIYVALSRTLFSSVAIFCVFLLVIAVGCSGVTSFRPLGVEKERALVGSWLVLHGLFAKFWTNDIVDDKLLENHHETTNNPVKCDTGW